jgi:hypothetical protein
MEREASKKHKKEKSSRKGEKRRKDKAEKKAKKRRRSRSRSSSASSSSSDGDARAETPAQELARLREACTQLRALLRSFPDVPRRDVRLLLWNVDAGQGVDLTPLPGALCRARRADLARAGLTRYTPARLLADERLRAALTRLFDTLKLKRTPSGLHVALPGAPPVLRAVGHVFDEPLDAQLPPHPDPPPADPLRRHAAPIGAWRLMALRAAASTYAFLLRQARPSRRACSMCTLALRARATTATLTATSQRGRPQQQRPARRRRAAPSGPLRRLAPPWRLPRAACSALPCPRRSCSRRLRCCLSSSRARRRLSWWRRLRARAPSRESRPPRACCAAWRCRMPSATRTRCLRCSRVPARAR